MRRLAIPDYHVNDVFYECVEGIGDKTVHPVFHKHANTIENMANQYNANAASETLFSLKPVIRAPRGSDPIVFGSLKKSDLTKLYTDYMVNKDKPARHIYDEIKAAANEKCPFCGGIGVPKTLDHYLPKAHFPQYSILPVNLIPCCRDCNTEKSTDIANNQGEQVLHPYLDDDRYFYENWISATVLHQDPVAIRFYVSAPENWPMYCKERAKSHFKAYGLRKRYGTQAASELSELVYSRGGSYKKWSPEEFKEYLSDKASNPSLNANNWKKVMYDALAKDDWFCSQTFERR